MRWIHAAISCLVLCLASNGLAQTPHSPALRHADALIRQGKPEQAWQLLAPLEIQHAGEPNFDYLLGIAALESGRPNRATFILERVIAGNPGHLAARLEMARAYFALGDYERAEREFDLILKSSPTPQTRAVTRSYLARLPERSPLANDRFSGYLEITLGRDTNVTAASAQTDVPLPALGTEFLPDSLSQRRPDDFAALGASLEYSHFLRSGLALIGGVDFRQRWNSDMDAYDTRIIDLQVALRHELRGGDRMQYSVRHNDFELDNSGYRETQGLAAQWTRAWGGRARIGISSDAYRIRYRSEEAQAGNSNLVAIGANGTYLLHERSGTLVVGGIYIGEDNAVAARVDGDRRIYGLSVGGQRRILPQIDAFARYSLLRSRYEEENPGFGVTRRDRQHDAAIGVSWQMAKLWSVHPQIVRTRNRSNLPLNEYSRTETSLSLRRAF